MALSNILGIYLGSLGITRAYLGSNLVFSSGPAQVRPSIVSVTKKTKDDDFMTAESLSHTQTAGNKLLVLYATRKSWQGAPVVTITYNGVAPDAEGSFLSNGDAYLNYALWNSPASGTNTLAFSYDVAVWNQITYAIDIADAGSISQTAEDTGGEWGTDISHDIAIASENSLLFLWGSAYDCASMAAMSATGMTVYSYDETNGSDWNGLCAGLAYESNPSTGTRSITAGFTTAATNWVFGASLVIGPA